MRLFSDVETPMNGAERITEYTSLPSEGKAVSFRSIPHLILLLTRLLILCQHPRIKSLWTLPLVKNVKTSLLVNDSSSPRPELWSETVILSSVTKEQSLLTKRRIERFNVRSITASDPKLSSMLSIVCTPSLNMTYLRHGQGGNRRVRHSKNTVARQEAFSSGMCPKK